MFILNQKKKKKITCQLSEKKRGFVTALHQYTVSETLSVARSLSVPRCVTLMDV